MPKGIKGPLCTPKRVGIIVVEFGLTVLIQWNLTNALFISSHVTVFSIDITDDPSTL